MAKLLKALGCSNVELAENGQIAVSKAASSEFDVILMDIHVCRQRVDYLPGAACIAETEIKCGS
jgi:CheY-like chemotaxis protein